MNLASFLQNLGIAIDRIGQGHAAAEGTEASPSPSFAAVLKTVVASAVEPANVSATTRTGEGTEDSADASMEAMHPALSPTRPDSTSIEIAAEEEATVLFASSDESSHPGLDQEEFLSGEPVEAQYGGSARKGLSAGSSPNAERPVTGSVSDTTEPAVRPTDPEAATDDHTKLPANSSPQVKSLTTGRSNDAPPPPSHSTAPTAEIVEGANEPRSHSAESHIQPRTDDRPANTDAPVVAAKSEAADTTTMLKNESTEGGPNLEAHGVPANPGRPVVPLGVTDSAIRGPGPGATGPASSMGHIDVLEVHGGLLARTKSAEIPVPPPLLANSEPVTVARIVLDRIFGPLDRTPLTGAAQQMDIDTGGEMKSGRNDQSLRSDVASPKAPPTTSAGEVEQAQPDARQSSIADGGVPSGLDNDAPELPGDRIATSTAGLEKVETLRAEPRHAASNHSSGSAPTRPDEAPWLNSLLRRSPQLQRAPDGTSILRLELGKDANTLTIRSRNDGHQMVIALGFSDPVLQAGAELRTEEIRTALQSVFDSAVDLSFSHGEADQGRETFTRHSLEGQRGLQALNRDDDSLVLDDLASRPRDLYTHVSGGRYEWVG